MRFFVALAALAASASAAVTVTSVEKVTVTSCGSYVTDCPGTKHASPVTTPTYAPAPPPAHNGTVITSTIYSSVTKTIISCGSTVTDCPAASTAYTVVVVPVSTTICPVSESHPTLATTVRLSTGPAYPNPSKTTTPGWYGTTG